MKVELPADEMQGRRAGGIAEWSAAAGEVVMGGWRVQSGAPRGEDVAGSR